MITHDYKLIFIHIPKCGGRSISNMFGQKFSHFTHSHYVREYQHFYSRYETFAIVRNPYARLVSMYHYIQQHRRHSHEPVAATQWISATVNKEPNFKDWVKKNFSAFLFWFEFDSPEGQRGTDYELGSPFWFSPQVAFMSIDEEKADFGSSRLFKLEDGMDKVSAWLKEKMVPNPEIPVLNTSKHKPWQEYYDAELIEFVNKQDFIKVDCEAFGYELLK